MGAPSRGAPRSLLALAYLAFISLGLPDTVLGVAWPSLRAEFGLPPAAFGLVQGANVAGYFASGMLAGRLAAALGVGGVLAASTACVAVALAGQASAPGAGPFVALAAAVGLGSGAVDAALNAFAARRFPVRHLNWLHACYSLGATAGPALMTAVLARGAPFRAGYALLAASAGAMGVAFAATRRWWDDRAPDPGAAATAPATIATAERTPPRPSRAAAPLQVATFFVYTGLEAAAGAWCFTLLRDGHGLPVGDAGAWTTAYWASLFAARIALGFVIDRAGPDRLLRVSTALSLAGAALFAIDRGVAGRLGLVVLGASLAPVFPTLMARTPARLGDAATARAVGFQVSAATLGVAVFPGLIGVLVGALGVGAIGAAVATQAIALLALHEALLRATRGR